MFIVLMELYSVYVGHFIVSDGKNNIIYTQYIHCSQSARLPMLRITLSKWLMKISLQITLMACALTLSIFHCQSQHRTQPAKLQGIATYSRNTIAETSALRQPITSQLSTHQTTYKRVKFHTNIYSGTNDIAAPSVLCHPITTHVYIGVHLQKWLILFLINWFSLWK